MVASRDSSIESPSLSLKMMKVQASVREMGDEITTLPFLFLLLLLFSRPEAHKTPAHLRRPCRWID